MNQQAFTNPFCAICGQPMKYFGAGTKADGSPLSASYRCPGTCRGKGTAVWLRTEGPPQQAQQRPVNGAGQAPRPAMASDTRDRSIEAQAACKAACDAAAGGVAAALMANGGDAVAVTEWIVTAARRMLREVVYPATGAPLPQGLSIARTPWQARTPEPVPAFPGDEAPAFGDAPYGEQR